MPDIIKQIVDEEIELPGYPLQVSTYSIYINTYFFKIANMPL